MITDVDALLLHQLTAGCMQSHILQRGTVIFTLRLQRQCESWGAIVTTLEQGRGWCVTIWQPWVWGRRGRETTRCSILNSTATTILITVLVAPLNLPLLYLQLQQNRRPLQTCYLILWSNCLKPIDYLSTVHRSHRFGWSSNAIQISLTCRCMSCYQCLSG